MILEVSLLPIAKAELNTSIQNFQLWPRAKKAIKVYPDSTVKEYSFTVRLENYYTYPVIRINKVEIIELFLVKSEDDLYTYSSRPLSASSFLGFNLGLMELELLLDGDCISLTTLNNKASKCDPKQISYVYESVSESPLFTLFIHNYRRANSLAQLLADSDIHFWVTLITIHQLVFELNRMSSGDNEFISEIRRQSTVTKYNRLSQIEEEDIVWLTQNPSQLKLSTDGVLALSGLRYEIEEISQTNLKSSYDTYENRVIVTCLYSMKSRLCDLLHDYKDDDTFPVRSIESILDQLETVAGRLISALSIKPPFATYPKYTSRLSNDPRYSPINELIAQWYSMYEITFGSRFLAPTLSFTKVFEHYCIIQIVKAYETLGFSVHYGARSDKNITSTIVLKRDNDTLTLLYEPSIKCDHNNPAFNSRLGSAFLSPDILMHYESSDKCLCGVIDAKFSSPDIVRNKLGPEIFHKYGLFLHKRNSDPLDFVMAAIPSVTSESDIEFARHDIYAVNIRPILGFFSIPLSPTAPAAISQLLSRLIS